MTDVTTFQPLSAEQKDQVRKFIDWIRRKKPQKITNALCRINENNTLVYCIEGLVLEYGGFKKVLEVDGEKAYIGFIRKDLRFPSVAVATESDYQAAGLPYLHVQQKCFFDALEALGALELTFPAELERAIYEHISLLEINQKTKLDFQQMADVLEYCLNNDGLEDRLTNL